LKKIFKKRKQIDTAVSIIIRLSNQQKNRHLLIDNKLN